MKKARFQIDCIEMKRSIQKKLSSEMNGMSPNDKVKFIKSLVSKSPFAALFKRSAA
jgi:hypothetical protein